MRLKCSVLLPLNQLYDANNNEIILAFRITFRLGNSTTTTSLFALQLQLLGSRDFRNHEFYRGTNLSLVAAVVHIAVYTWQHAFPRKVLRINPDLLVLRSGARYFYELIIAVMLCIMESIMNANLDRVLICWTVIIHSMLNFLSPPEIWHCQVAGLKYAKRKKGPHNRMCCPFEWWWRICDNI